MNKMRYVYGEARREGRSVSETMASFSKFFMPFLKHDSSIVLDLGAGNGRFSHALSGLSKRVIAIDSHDRQDPNYERENIEFQNVEFEKFEPNTKFDMCFMWGVWYHLFTREDKDEMFDRLLSMMNDSGVVVVIDDVHTKSQTLNFINENVDKAKILAIDYDDRSANFCLVFKKIGVNNNEA